VAWAADDSQVVVGPTYLPLATLDSGERKRRTQTPAIVAVSPTDGEIERITDLDADGAGVAALQWLRNGDVLVERRVGGVAGTTPPAQRYRKTRGEWHQARAVARKNSAGSPSTLEFSVVQSLDKAPEIQVRDAATGKSRVVTDLNPQFRQLSF